MNAENTVNSFLGTAPSIIDPKEFILNLVIASIMSLILGLVYRRLSPVVADRAGFSRNFFMLSTITLLIITVVKSSLALSLGLVGALSIIRFRSAIKDPEELTFIFLSMSIGLGLGANQRMITLLGFIFIVFIYSVRALVKLKGDKQIYHLVLSSNSNDIGLTEKVLEIVKKHTSLVKLKRLDQQSQTSEITLSVEIDKYEDLKKIQEELKSIDSNLNFTFMDLKGLLR